jgi:peptidyl-prolyl cis-trans isomerase B (cyclophilin B)
MKGLGVMLKNRFSRVLVATTTAVTAAAGISLALVGQAPAGHASTGQAPAGHASTGHASTGHASTGHASTGPSLNAPGLRAQVNQANTADACGYHFQIPADRFKGVPVFDPAKAAQPFDVRFYTTQGVITVQMLTSAAPCTTFSFRFLASKNYFNQTHCHRLTVQRIFVLQCGDPTGTGSGGPGYAFNDENLAGATYPAGTVAMANAGPNTNGSQFFFTWKDTTLRPNYTPFGKVISGMDVLQRIAAAGDDEQNNPGDGYPNRYTAFYAVQIIPVRR